MTEASSIISFSVNPTYSSSCSHNAAVVESSSQHCQSYSSQTSTVSAAVSSTQPPPFTQLSGPQQISDVPQASVQANNVTPQHYVALQPTFLPSEGDTQASVHPPAVPALAPTPPGPVAVAAPPAEGLVAVTQPVPLANPPVTNSGPSLAPAPATITIASTPNLLQPSLVMSDQNLQWILSSAANSQQNLEQTVSSASDEALQPGNSLDIFVKSSQNDFCVFIHIYIYIMYVFVHSPNKELQKLKRSSSLQPYQWEQTLVRQLVVSRCFHERL